MRNILLKKQNKWIYIPLSIIIFICLGTVYSYSVFKKPVEELYGVNSTLSNLPYMLFLFSYSVLMPLTGRYIDRFGPGKIMSFGGILLGAGWILSGLKANILIMILGYGFIAGSAVGIIYGVPIYFLSTLYRNNKGSVLGIILSGFGLSPFITAPIARFLINKYGLLSALRTLGFVFMAVILLCSIIFPFQKISNNTKSENTINKEVKLIKNKNFTGLWVLFMIGTLIGLMMIGITSPVGEELFSLDATKTAYFVSLFAVFNAIGRPLFGWICDKYKPKNAAILSFFLIFISGIIIIFSNNITLAYVIAFSIYWLNLGGWLSIAPTATAYYFGMRDYSKIYGLIFTAYGVGALLGGAISGNIKELFNSYHYVFYPSSALALIGIILSYRFLKDKKDINY